MCKIKKIKTFEVKNLTKESLSEQKSAGLNQCSIEEFEKLHTMNNSYNKKFNFPFIRHSPE